MTAPVLSKTDRLRARDGDGCWLCGGTLDFEAKSNSKKAPTREHLQPLSADGTDALDNLVLCHPGCNRQLGNRPRADKEAMRARRISKAAASAAPKPPAREAPQRAKPPGATARTIARTKEVDWRTLAWGAISVAMFFGGLALGLLLA